MLYEPRYYRFGLPLIYLLQLDICLTMPKRRKSSLGRLTASAIRARLRRKRETSPERERRLTKDRVRAATRREFETAAEREYRLAMDRARAASRRERHREREEKEYRLELDKVRDIAQRERGERQIRLFLDRVRREIEAQSSTLGVQDHPESVLPDVPGVLNLDIMKKESIDHTEESLPSTAQNISAVQDWNNFTQYQKSEPCDDSVDDMIIPVNPDDIAPQETSSDIVDSSSTSTDHTCANSAEHSLKWQNISLSSPTSNAKIKDELSDFGDFVADKICSFTDKSLRVEAQHRITNIVCDMKMKDLKEDLQPPKSATVTLPSSSTDSRILSLKTELPTAATLPSNSEICCSSKLQTQLTGTVTLPFCPTIKENSSLPTPLTATKTLSSSSVTNRISSLKNALYVTVTMPSSSVVPVIIPITTTNTTDLCTQVVTTGAPKLT